MTVPLELRPATSADAARIAEIYEPSVTESSTSFEEAPPNARDMAARVESTLETHPWLVCTERGHVIGYAYAAPHRSRHAYQWSTEVSVYIDRDAHRRGAASRLYRTLFDVLARQGYANVYAGITLPNEASVAFHRAIGFETIGTYELIGYKRGAWHDVLWLGMRLEIDDSRPPAAPIPFAQLANEIDWSSFTR